jgi:prevent-host-death family protein
MSPVNMLEAKSNLSRLVEAVESGKESEIIIARNGRPAARLVPIAAPPVPIQRIGVAKGEFAVPDDFDALDAEIEALFKDAADLLPERQQD